MDRFDHDHSAGEGDKAAKLSGRLFAAQGDAPERVQSADNLLDPRRVTGGEQLPMLVIFDFDGTLADTWPWFAEEIVRSAERFRYRSLTRSEVEQLRALGTREILKTLGIPQWRVYRLAAHMRRHAEAAAGGVQLFTGVPELIAALHEAGVTLAVASSNSEATVRQALGQRLAALVQFYACKAAVFGKAAKFRRLVRRAGVEPGRTIAVGDETRDVEAADIAGIRGVAVEWGYAEAALLRAFAPGRTVASVSELTDMLLKAAESRERCTNGSSG